MVGWVVVLGVIAVVALFLLTRPGDTEPMTQPDKIAGVWRHLPEQPGQARREGQTAVWTGSEMIVWGGFGIDVEEEPVGASYDPEADEWRALPPAPIETRWGHTVTWTGEEIVVFGGVSDRPEETAAAYDPASDSWRELAPSPLPVLSYHSAVWTGTEMIVIGGEAPDSDQVSAAAAYSPATDSWRPLADSPVIGAGVSLGQGQSGVWSGSHALVYGVGEKPAGAYDPVADSWEVLQDPLVGPRIWQSVVWTNSEMIVWGGTGRDSSFPAGIAYRPETGTWRSLAEAPVTERERNLAVWTGAHMLIWGGSPMEPVEPEERLGSAIAYDPEADRWLEVDAPSVQGRTSSAVWTGDSAIVWTGDPTTSLIFTPG
jgi:N-acetylneuraminic acid mutarotase